MELKCSGCDLTLLKDRWGMYWSKVDEVWYCYPCVDKRLGRTAEGFILTNEEQINE